MITYSTVICSLNSAAYNFCTHAICHPITRYQCQLSSNPHVALLIKYYNYHTILIQNGNFILACTDISSQFTHFLEYFYLPT